MDEDMMQQQVLDQAALAGRSTDTVMAHLTVGEVVIPAEIASDPEVRQVLASIFESYQVNPAEFTVGMQENKINPQTGQPEFFFKKIFKKIAPIALPILGTMIPGVGTALGGALGGAAGGLVSGGGLKGALTGGLLGGLGGSVLGGSGASGLLGNKAGTTLAEVTGNAALQGPTLGTGIRGALSGGGLNALTSGAGGSGLTNLARAGASFLGGNEEEEAMKRARNALLSAQGRTEAVLNPYSEMGLSAQQKLAENLAQGFNPGDLSNDPGYQFRLKQGQDSLNATLAAQGLGQSGAAIKAAQEYGQGFAANEYSNAYDRWLAQNQQLGSVGGQGFNAAQSLGNVYGDTASATALYNMLRANAKNKRLAEILSGLGA